MPVIRATFSDCFAMYATLRSGEKNSLGNAVPAMGAEHVTLCRRGHAFETRWIGQCTKDCFCQSLGISAVHQEAVAPAVDQLGQAVSRESHDRCAREHGLELDLAPRTVEHRLHHPPVAALH